MLLYFKLRRGQNHLRKIGLKRGCESGGFKGLPAKPTFLNRGQNLDFKTMQNRFCNLCKTIFRATVRRPLSSFGLELYSFDLVRFHH